MSAHTKRLKKELYGHPSVVGHDVVSMGIATVSGVVGHTAQALQSWDRFVSPRAGFIDFACANVAPVIASGSLEVAVHLNGAVVMSGALSSANSAQLANVFNADAGNALPIASGDVIQMFYAISAGLGSVGVGANHHLNTRVGITYRDAQ